MKQAVRAHFLVALSMLTAFAVRADEAETRRLAEAFGATPALWNS